MSSEKQRRHRNTLNLLTGIAWICLFLYSLYILIGAMWSGRPYTVFHIVASFVLLLVVIRSVRRYLQFK